MSRYFVNDPPVAVPEFDPSEVISDTRPNVIYILARMNVEVSGRVTSELFTMDREKGSMEAHVGANQTALLVHNIVRWEGPDFDGVPCTDERKRTLDPNEPHIVKVLEEIAIRNKKRVSPNPKSTATADTSMSAGVADSTASEQSVILSESGTPRSSLLRSLDGRRERSENSILTS